VGLRRYALRVCRIGYGRRAGTCPTLVT
jgi:hypothetical protein